MGSPDNSFDDAQASAALQAGDAVIPTTASLPLRQALIQQPVAQPQIHDVTEKFTRACQALDIGQLVKDEYFTLFESVGAIEIMDAKMDSGFLRPGESPEDDYDTLAPLLPEELIGIMDQLLCYEMAWHTGYPLSQTLFTSVYIDKLLWPEPKSVVQAQFYKGEIPNEKRPGTLLEVLRAYCLALIKGCDFAISKITNRDYFEEEDFCTHTYNRVLFVSVPLDVFLRELDTAVEAVEDTNFEINDGMRKAIVSRLEWRKSFLTALDPDGPLEQLSRYWSPILEGVSSIASTHQLAKPVSGAFSTKMQRRLASTVPPRPIVELDFKDALEKLKQLCIDCEEATRFISLEQDPLEYQSYAWYFSARSPKPLPYSRAYLSNLLFHPDILYTNVSLPLTDIKSLVFPSSPILDPRNWTISPPRNSLLPKPPGLQFALLIDEFVERAGQPYVDMWITMGQNRCRLRRMLTHVIIGWDLLQADASLVDEDLMRVAGELGTDITKQILPSSLSIWVYERKLWMIEKVVLLGFEQDIYLPDEFGAMYLFLHQVSAKRYELLKRVKEHCMIRSEQLQHSKTQSPNPMTTPLQEARAVEAASTHVDALLACADATCHLSSALSKFYVLLLYLHLLPRPTRPYSSAELRHELRMKPFLSLNPPEVPPFSEFDAHLHPHGAYDSPESTLREQIFGSNSLMWTEIDEHIAKAKEGFTRLRRFGAAAVGAEGMKEAWAKEVNGLLASCVALGVAVVGVKRAFGKADEGGASNLETDVSIEIPEAETGKRYCEGWVVGKVLKKG